MKLLFVLSTFFLNTCFCQENIYNVFEEINKKYTQFNAIGAEIAWEASINPDNTELAGRTANYQKKLLLWQQSTCDQLAALESRHLINNTQRRQTYLLCRGPKFTYKEARIISSIYDQLRSIYSDAKICIPTQKYITKNNYTETEAAILDYLATVKNVLKINNWVDYAAKIATGDSQGKNMICLNGENEFEILMEYSRNEEVLKWLWLAWREKVGPLMKEPYRELVDVENKAAWRNGYTDIGASWRDDLEIPNLRQMSRRLYSSVQPLYRLLHGVVRFCLRRLYGDIVPERGPIPAHLLGNLWSQNWEPLIDMISPRNINLDESIRNLNWTVQHMVKRAEDFYQSLGLPPMTDTFWRESVFKNQNGATRCHGTAADMFKDGDFRLLYCSGMTMKDFYVIHHEFGHIQYYMAYDNQPGLFRQANAALHESIGDAIMLGVMTPQHLHRLGLVNDSILFTNNSDNSPKIYQQQKNDDNLASNEDLNVLKTIHDRFNTDNVETNEYHGKDETAFDNNPIVETKIFSLASNEDLNVPKTKHDRYNTDNVETNEYHGKDETAYDNNPTVETKVFEREVYNDRNQKGNIQKREFKVELTTDEILLLKQALNKIPQIPFALLIDEYRWKYFEGGIDWRSSNKYFWNLTLELQGISPPEERSEQYFDVGAKFHVPDNTPYIRYFLSSFIQHQLFEALCRAAVFGRRDVTTRIPDTISLHRCDIYGSKAAGKLLKDFMSRGTSQHWREILQSTTGITDISAGALERYYRPLYKVLTQIVTENEIPLGWK